MKLFVTKRFAGIQPRRFPFEILLPGSETSDLPSAAKRADEPPPKGNETILLVEDEPSVRKLTRVVLERQGYRVLEAADGIEALRVWESRADSIDLLVTDMVMPEGISGFELAAQLRQRNAKLRVIFMSGYNAEIVGRELTLQEGQNFLQKPCSLVRILEAVRRSLDGQ